jgi:hypothetical protein
MDQQLQSAMFMWVVTPYGLQIDTNVSEGKDLFRSVDESTMFF